MLSPMPRYYRSTVHRNINVGWCDVELIGVYKLYVCVQGATKNSPTPKVWLRSNVWILLHQILCPLCNTHLSINLFVFPKLLYVYDVGVTLEFWFEFCNSPLSLYYVNIYENKRVPVSLIVKATKLQSHVFVSAGVCDFASKSNEGRLHFVGERANVSANYYVAKIGGRLSLYAGKWFCVATDCFPTHWQECLGERCSDFIVKDWRPPNSPDLNLLVTCVQPCWRSLTSLFRSLGTLLSWRSICR